MRREDLVKGDIYKVIANASGHEFEIGEHVEYRHVDDNGDLVMYKLDGSDYWYMSPFELEELT